MTSGSRASALREIGTLYGPGAVAGLSDGELLERFLACRDEGAEAAFAALVARHGPMVLGVCRRALADPGDADDAFQATFLILARKARSVRVDDSLGRWLYGVSRKVAARARALAARRPRHLPGALESIATRSPDPDGFEFWSTLDEELARLPEVYRSAVVLCDLGGMTHEEAARDLGCPVGTIKSRLTRARARLRAGLERRGLAPSMRMAAPIVPARLVEAVARSSGVSGVGGASAAGVVPASAVALAEGMLGTMTAIKLKLAAAAILSIGVAATGAGVMARQDRGGNAPSAASATPVNRVEADRPPRIDREARDRLDATLLAELDRARRVLAKAEGDPRDPTVARARRRVSDLERAVQQFRDVFSTLADDENGLARLPGRSRTPWPVGGPKTQPGEFTKVSMPDYIVEPPDILQIEVMEALPGQPITGERLVRPDGKISLGFYGEVYVAGLTTSEIKEKVILKLREFLDDTTLGLKQINPITRQAEDVPPGRSSRVLVEVTAYNSKVYYVQGEVGTPGRLPVTGNETVLDAINYSGGLKPSASKTSIRVVRPDPKQPGTEHHLSVDLAAIVDRGDSRTNYQLLPGDRLIVYRDEKVAPDEPQPAPRVPPADVEARLQAVERKLDEVLGALGRIAKP